MKCVKLKFTQQPNLMKHAFHCFCWWLYGITMVIFTNSKIGMVVILLIEGLVGYLWSWWVCKCANMLCMSWWQRKIIAFGWRLPWCTLSAQWCTLSAAMIRKQSSGCFEDSGNAVCNKNLIQICGSGCKGGDWFVDRDKKCEEEQGGFATLWAGKQSWESGATLLLQATSVDPHCALLQASMYSN